MRWIFIGFGWMTTELGLIRAGKARPLIWTTLVISLLIPEPQIGADIQNFVDVSVFVNVVIRLYNMSEINDRAE